MRIPVLVSVLLLAIAAVAPLTQAQGDGPQFVEVIAEEDCPSDRTYCFEVNVTEIQAGVPVNVTVINREDNTAQHSYFFDWDGDADRSGHDSDAGTGDASVQALAGNESGSTEFTIPTDAEDRLYIWCNEPGHEGIGMWTFIDITGTEGDGDGMPGDDDDGDPPPSTPGFAAIGAIVAAGAAALVLRRSS